MRVTRLNTSTKKHCKLLYLKYMVCNEQKRLKMAEKKCFDQLLGASSTQKLVEIHNLYLTIPSRRRIVIGVILVLLYTLESPDLGVILFLLYTLESPDLGVIFHCFTFRLCFFLQFSPLDSALEPRVKSTLSIYVVLPLTSLLLTVL